MPDGPTPNSWPPVSNKSLKATNHGPTKQLSWQVVAYFRNFSSCCILKANESTILENNTIAVFNFRTLKNILHSLLSRRSPALRPSTPTQLKPFYQSPKSFLPLNPHLGQGHHINSHVFPSSHNSLIKRCPLTTTWMKSCIATPFTLRCNQLNLATDFKVVSVDDSFSMKIILGKEI